MHVAELAKWWSEAQEHAKPHLAAKAVLAYMREADGHTADLDELRELLTDNGVDASMQLHVLANMVDDGWLREGEGDEYYLGARGHEESQPEQGEEDSDASQLSTVRLALQPGEEYFTQPPGSGWEFVRQGPHGGHVYRPVTGQQAASQPTPSPAQQGGKPGLLARAAAGAAKAGKAIASTILSQLSPSSILERIKGAGHVLAHPVESIRKKYDSLYERYGPAGAMAIGGAYAAYYTAAALNPIMLAYPVPLTATILGSARVLRYGILKGRGKDVQFSLESPEADQADMLSEAKRLIADMAAEAGEEPPQIDDDLLAQVMAGLMQHGEEQPTEEQLSLIRLASKGHDDSAPSLFDTPAGEQSRETEAHDGKKPGEFAPKEKGSGQPAHKERANAIQAKKDELKQQLKQMRHEGFNSLKADATKAKDAAGEMTDTLNDHVDNLSWADEAETEPDEPAYNLDPDNPQPRENWDGLPEEESGGLSYEEALAQDKKDKAEYEQALAKQQAYPDDAANLHEELEGLTRTLPGGPDDEDLTPSEHFERLGEIIDKAKEMQGVDWTASGIFTPEELADQKQVIAGLIKDAKQAREHLRQYSRHRKEMDAIRRGETMELSLESADEAEYARILDAADDSDVDLDSGSPRLSLSTAGESLRDKVRRLARKRYPTLRMSNDSPSWVHYEGPRHGHGWKSAKTGVVIYQEDMPGEHEHTVGPEPAKPPKKPAKVKALRGPMMEAGRIEKDEKNEARVLLKNGQPAPSHIDASMIGRDWTDVQVSLDPDADVLVIAADAKGKPKTVYSDKWDDGASARKFARVEEMMRKSAVMSKEVQAARTGANKEHADCAFLIEQQGTRPGSDSDTKGLNHLLGVELSPRDVIVAPVEDEKTGQLKDAMFLRINGQYVHVKDEGTAEQLARAKEAGKVGDSDYWIKSFGATTLEGRHVVEASDGVRLQFVGKEGVWHDHLVKDTQLAAMLLERKKAGGDRSRLFKTTETKLNKFIAELDGGLFTAKDFRTKRANEIAISHVKNTEKPATMKEYKAAVLEAGKAASHVLGNDPAMALSSYINPAVFSGWFAGLSPEERAKAEKPAKPVKENDA